MVNLGYTSKKGKLIISNQNNDKHHLIFFNIDKYILVNKDSIESYMYKTLFK